MVLDAILFFYKYYLIFVFLSLIVTTYVILRIEWRTSADEVLDSILRFLD